MASTSRGALFGAPLGTLDKTRSQSTARPPMTGTRLPTKSTVSTSIQADASSNAEPQPSIPKPGEKKTAKLRRKMPEKEQMKQTKGQGNAHPVLPVSRGPQQVKTQLAQPLYSPNHSPDSVESSSLPTPSLGSASSMSTPDSPRSNTLRRKPPIISNYMSSLKRSRSFSKKGELPPTSSPGTEEPLPALSQAAIEKHTIRYLQSPSQPQNQGVDGFVQYGHLHRTDSNIPSVTPVSNASATPSIPHTDSPGAFSRGTTPTSKTSYSPLMSHSPHMGPAAWNSPVHAAGKAKVASPAENYPLRSTSHTDDNSMSRQRDVTAQTTLARLETADIPIAPPPELAHLVENQQSPQQQAASPKRPSRAGTTKLQVSRDPSPVIMSNLPRSYTLQQHRARSSSRGADATTASSVTPVNSPTSQPSRRLSKSQPPQLRNVGEPSAPPLPRTSTNVSRESPSPIASPNEAVSPPTKVASRFGFFSRRPKAEATMPAKAISPVEKKGPMAGTGYETYAIKPVKRKSGGASSARSYSTASPTGASASGNFDQWKRSDSSSRNDNGVDDFLGQRLSPVYIRGDGSASDTQVVTHSTARGGSQGTINSEAATSSSFNSPQTSHTSYSSATGRAYLGKEPLVGAPSQVPALQSRLPLGTTIKPPMDNGRVLDKSPSIGTNTEVDSQYSSSIDSTRQQIALPKALEGEKARKSMWSLFTKTAKSSQKTPALPYQTRDDTPEPVSEEIAPSTVPADIVAKDNVQTMAHYAILPASYDVEIEDIEGIMQEARAAEPERSSGIVQLHDMRGKQYEGLTPEQLESLHFPMFSPFMHESPVPSVSSISEVSDFPFPRLPSRTGPAEIASNAQPVRPSRLAQVGRIPKVVSNRDEGRTFPDVSFSRPFSPEQQRTGFGSAANSNFVNGNVGRSESSNLNETMRFAPSANTPFEDDGTDIGEGPSRALPDAPREFFRFSIRKDSDRSYNSSSSGCGWFSSNPYTAVLPAVGSPPSEDEVWTEYDDLIDNVLTPVDGESSRGNYFGGRSTTAPQKPAALEKSIPMVTSKSALKNPINIPHPLFATSTEPRYASNYLSPTTPAMSQYSPSSVYDEEKTAPQNISANTAKAQASSNSPTTFTTRTSDSSSTPVAASVPEIAARVKFDRDSQELYSPQGSEGNKSNRSSGEKRISAGLKKADNMANLRFSALMTSKWLSFGRVLFSPAHNELSDNGDDRILVIDGLGKDWSYYCALTYPRATVYSLGPGAGNSPSRKSLGAWQSLPNHRHISYPNLGANFPFPKSFFATVVFRFPTAISETTLKSVISECKRVLRPGGYIEVSSLDLDLSNMGNRARRAVRNMKTKMYKTLPDVSLKPASDNIQRLLGRRGFENLNRCLVGIPVAGSISSKDNSTSGRDTSFAELVRDESSESDQGITTMVARVGRWWYTRCYETAILPENDTSESIWNNKELLKECEELQTTFRLLICHAQKPAVTRRRTVSL